MCLDVLLECEQSSLFQIYFLFFLVIPLKVCQISGILKSLLQIWKKAWSWFNCFKIVTILSFLQGQSHWCQKPRSYWGTCMHQSAVSRQHFETWFRMSACLNLAWLFLHLIWKKVWKMSGFCCSNPEKVNIAIFFIMGVKYSIKCSSVHVWLIQQHWFSFTHYANLSYLDLVLNSSGIRSTQQIFIGQLQLLQTIQCRGRERELFLCVIWYQGIFAWFNFSSGDSFLPCYIILVTAVSVFFFFLCIFLFFTHTHTHTQTSSFLNTRFYNTRSHQQGWAHHILQDLQKCAH